MVFGALDEAELVERCRTGSQQGYTDLFERYKARALRVAYVITLDVALSEDAVQDAFIQAFRGLQHLRPGAPFHPWFFAIVANCARRLARRRQAWRWMPLKLAETHADPQAADAFESLESGAVWQAVQQLPVGLRTLVALRYVLNMTETEAAEVLHIPVGTVKSRMHRARQLLQQALGTDREELSVHGCL